MIGNVKCFYRLFCGLGTGKSGSITENVGVKMSFFDVRIVTTNANLNHQFRYSNISPFSEYMEKDVTER